MKKTLIALAAVAATGAVFAQSTATISGSMQVGISDSGQAGAKSQVTHLGNGANAINIASTEDLGGGLKAGFTGQIRFNATNGDVNSSGVTADRELFHAANVFVSGGFGTVRIGKIAETGHCSFDPWGCGGGAALQAGVGVSALVGSGTQASSVSYATPNISGFSAGYQTSVSTAAFERRVFNLGYANGPLAVSFVRVSNGGNAALGGAPAAVKSSDQSIAASYDFGMAKVSLVNTVKENAAGTKTASITSLGAKVPMGAFTVLAGYNNDSKAANTADSKMSVGVDYALSKRTVVGADLYKAENVGASTGYVLRVRHAF